MFVSFSSSSASELSFPSCVDLLENEPLVCILIDLLKVLSNGPVASRLYESSIKNTEAAIHKIIVSLLKKGTLLVRY